MNLFWTVVELPDTLARSISNILPFANDAYTLLNQYWNFLNQFFVYGFSNTNEWSELYDLDHSITLDIKEIIIDLIDKEFIVMNALIAKLKEQPDNPLLNILSILKNPIIGILDQSEVEFILQKYEKINSNDYKKDLIDYLEDVQEIDLELIFKHPVLIYLFLVKIPCWCFYYTDVKTLFRDAINGDLDSICKLIRLDRTIMHHPDIIMHINEVSENRESDEFKKIIDAFTGKLPLPSRMDFKIDIARFIKDYVEASKSKISYQELLEIMLTQAGKLKGRSDPDLSGYTEEGTFAKTIRRKGKIIKKSNVKDKK